MTYLPLEYLPSVVRDLQAGGQLIAEIDVQIEALIANPPESFGVGWRQLDALHNQRDIAVDMTDAVLDNAELYCPCCRMSAGAIDRRGGCKCDDDYCARCGADSDDATYAAWKGAAS